jgi:hypothetical protein
MRGVSSWTAVSCELLRKSEVESYLDVLRKQPVEKMDVGGLEVHKVLELLNGSRLHGQEPQASLRLDVEALDGRRVQTICSKVLANIGRIGLAEVTAPTVSISSCKPWLCCCAAVVAYVVVSCLVAVGLCVGESD